MSHPSAGRWLLPAGVIALALHVGPALLVPAEGAEVAAPSGKEIQALIAGVRAAGAEGHLTQEQCDAVVGRLQILDVAQAEDAELVANTRDFVAGRVRPSLYAAYVKAAIGQEWARHLKYLQREAAAKNPRAQLWLAWAHVRSGQRHLLDGSFEQQLLPESHRKPYMAASALVESGQFKGDGRQAHELLQSAMAAGEPRAVALFGGLLVQGGNIVLRTPHDPELAMKFAQQASQDGDAYGSYLLAYLRGFGPQSLRDPKEALRLTTELADKRFINAKVLLAQCYYAGIGTVKDAARARKIAEEAAASGLGYALNMLGFFYEAGVGGPKQPQEAFKLYMRAAEREFPGAIVRVGDCLYAGVGVKQDKAAAAEWWARAGRAGAKEGYQKAGRAYADGDGVARNVGQAWVYFYLATGHDDTSTVREWAKTYRDAKEISGAAYLRHLKRVRVTARSLSKKRSDEEVQQIAERVVRARGWAVDHKADVEVKFIFHMVMEDRGRFNLAACGVQFRTHAPVLARGEFINVPVVLQWAVGAHKIVGGFLRADPDAELAAEARAVLTDAIKGWPESDHLEPRRVENSWKNDLWPEERDRAMYASWQTAKSFGRQGSGPPLGGFSSVSLPKTTITKELRGEGGVNARTLEKQWLAGLKEFGVDYEPDSPHVIVHGATSIGWGGFATEDWFISSYTACERRNVVIPLPDGPLVRMRVGLTGEHRFIAAKRGEPAERISEQAESFIKAVGPVIRDSLKVQLRPRFGVGRADGPAS